MMLLVACTCMAGSASMPPAAGIAMPGCKPPIAGALDGHWHAHDHHSIKLQGSIGLLDRSDLAKAIVRSLVACEPDVQHRVLVRIITHATLLHGVIELLREGILGDTQVVWQVAKVQSTHFTGD